MRSSLVSLVVFGSLCACDAAAQGEGEAPQFPPPEVATIVVEARAVPRARDLPGRLVSSRIAEVRARVSGVVLERVFTEGSEVQAGDVLFRIDPAVYRAEVDERAAALARAEATQAQAGREARRAETLYERQTGTSAQRDNTAAILKQAEADVAGARARLARARIDLGHATVRAPIRGRIGRALVTEGALVNAGEATHLATIQQVDPIYADFNEPLAAAEPGLEGAAGEVRLLGADGGLRGPVGKLVFTDVGVDPGTAQVRLRAAFSNPDGALLPGSYVRVRLARGPDVEAVVVPPQAIQRSSAGEAQVYVVDEQGVAALRPVQTGPLTDLGWIIENGIVAGETVVVEGFQKLQPGATIKSVPWVDPGAAKP